jgi:hypothetical protein
MKHEIDNDIVDFFYNAILPEISLLTLCGAKPIAVWNN